MGIDEPSEQYDKVRVARVGKPHGIRGEVTVEVFTDSPDTRFVEGTVLYVRMSMGQELLYGTLKLETARWNKKILLLKFEEISDRNTAESLRNAELYAPADNSLNDEDSWYASELIGLRVYLTNRDSKTIGEVSDLIPGDAQDLLEIRSVDGQKLLIPFVEEIVPEIDEEQGVIIITPPPGLLELNED